MAAKDVERTIEISKPSEQVFEVPLAGWGGSREQTLKARQELVRRFAVTFPPSRPARGRPTSGSH